MLVDARRLVRQMRNNGKTEEADELEGHIATAAKVLGSVALLAAGYYIGVKLRAGKLLFAWGWGATGTHFARVSARLERLVPEAEKAIGEVVKSARPNVPAGSGINWPVLDQVVNGTVQAQLDSAACGPACLAIVLADKGIKITQEELLRRTRAKIGDELKSKRITASTIFKVLTEVDPDGGWRGGRELKDHILRGRSARQIIDFLGQRGSWIAQVGVHFVVVEGFDASGHLLIRDPWYEPGLSRGINSGSSYRVSLRTFVQEWHAVAIYRE